MLLEAIRIYSKLRRAAASGKPARKAAVKKAVAAPAKPVVMKAAVKKAVAAPTEPVTKAVVNAAVKKAVAAPTKPVTKAVVKAAVKKAVGAPAKPVEKLDAKAKVGAIPGGAKTVAKATSVGAWSAAREQAMKKHPNDRTTMILEAKRIYSKFGQANRLAKKAAASGKPAGKAGKK